MRQRCFSITFFFDTVHSLDIYSKAKKKTNKLDHKINPSLCQWIKSDFNRIAHRLQII